MDEKTRASINERVELVKNALYMLFGRYSLEYLSLYAVLNRLLLLIQKPMIIVVHDGNDEVVFHTMRDPEIETLFEGHLAANPLAAGRLQIGSSAHALSFHRLRISKDVSETRFVALDEGNLEFVLFKELLERVSREPFGRQFVLKPLNERIATSITRDRDRRLPQPRPEQHLVEGSDGVAIEARLESIRGVIEALFEEIDQSPMINSAFDAEGVYPFPFPNIFFLVRTATTVRFNELFPYELRFIIPRGQRKLIKDHFAALTRDPRRCPAYDDGACKALELETCLLHETRRGSPVLEQPDSLVDMMTYPFGTAVRSMADSVFASGVVDFSGESIGEGRGRLLEGDSRKFDDSRELQRFLATRCIMHQIVPSSPSAFLVPVQVAGSVWMTAMTVNAGAASNDQILRSTPDWMQNYYFYLGVMSRTINRRVRQKTLDAYFSAVETAFDGLCQVAVKRRVGRIVVGVGGKMQFAWAKFIEAVGREFEELSQVFPFDKIAVRRMKPRYNVAEEWKKVRETCDARDFVDRELFDVPFLIYSVTNRHFNRVSASGRAYLNLEELADRLHDGALKWKQIWTTEVGKQRRAR